MGLVINGGFLPTDFGFVKEEPKPRPNDLAQRIEETREVYDFVERSTMFDQVMGIDRGKERYPSQNGRQYILWAARRNLFGVKLPSKEQILAMAKATPISPEERAERTAFQKALRGR